MLGMNYDRIKDELWVYSAKGVQLISIKNEDKDAWKLYVETNKYKEAYEICRKYKSNYTEYVRNLFSSIEKYLLQLDLLYLDVFRLGGYTLSSCLEIRNS